MQLGNPVALDAARHALRDAFDSAWMAETAKTPRAQRAAHCAVLLSKWDYANYRRSNSVIGRGWRVTAPDILICAAVPGGAECQRQSMLALFSDYFASSPS